MANITRHATRRRTRAQRSRLTLVLVVLFLVAPVVGLIFAAVYFGMRKRRRATPHAAADVATAPIRPADPGPTTRRAGIGAALRPTTGEFLTGAVAIAVGVAIAATAAAGSYAMLSNAQPVGSGGITLTAGTLGLTVNGSSSSSAVAMSSDFQNLLPGDYYQQPITYATTGNMPGDLKVRLGAAVSTYDVRFATGTCTAGYTTTASGTALSSTSDMTLPSLTAATSASGCVLVGLPTNAATSTNNTASVTATTASAPVTLTFTVTQQSS